MGEHDCSRLSRLAIICLCSVVLVSHIWGTDVDALGGCTACGLDMNRNGQVDLLDLAVVAARYAPGVRTTTPLGDANSDGYVDLFDLVLLARHYREPCCLLPAETTQHYGTRQCVEFQVVYSHPTENVAFLNSHLPFDGYFGVYIGRNLWGCWPQMPHVLFRGKTVRVSGLIEYYDTYRMPQIRLRAATISRC